MSTPQTPPLSRDARLLLRRVLSRDESASTPLSELSGNMRAMFFGLGWTAGETIRRMTEIPADREPWEWATDLAEENGLGDTFPFDDVMTLAGRLAKEHNRWVITPEELILSILYISGMPLKEPFWKEASKAAALLRGEGWEGLGSDEAEIMSLEEHLQAITEMERTRPKREKIRCPTLDSLARDLTREAAEGKLPPVAGRDREIQAVLETLCRVTKRNPLLVGPPGCGKTAVAAGVAQRIDLGLVPEALTGARLMALEAGDLVAGMMYVGSLQERMQKVIEEASQPGILLFIDEIHLAVGGGASRKSDQDVANLLKPALADGRISVIGATTDLEIGRLERDGAFARRFQMVPVEELGREEALVALRSRAAFLTKRTGVAIEDRSVVLAANLADRLIRHRVRPDKGIDVLEQATARAQMRARCSVEPELVREVLREMIGIPFKTAELRGRLRLMREVVEGLGLMDAETAGRLAERLQLTMLGLDVRPERPNAVILAAGPVESAEELARVLSETLLEREDFVRIDLPEGRGLAADRILGRESDSWKDVAPAFQRQLIHHPWSVILVTGLDNSEPEAVDILAGAVERGVLETPANRRVPFADGIFVIAVASDRARVPGFSPGGDGTEAGAARRAPIAGMLNRLGSRFAQQVDLACALATSTAGPGERWVRMRLLGPIATRWEAETGIRVSFDRAVAAALAGAAGGEAMDMPRLTQVFEERVAAPLAPVLATAPSGGRISVRLAGAEPLEVSISLSDPPATEQDEAEEQERPEEAEAAETPEELETPPA